MNEKEVNGQEAHLKSVGTAHQTHLRAQCRPTQ